MEEAQLAIISMSINLDYNKVLGAAFPDRAYMGGPKPVNEGA